MAFSGNLFFAAPAGSYGNRTWKYESAADNLATIKGSGYFDSVTSTLRQYDVIEITGSDGFTLVHVTSASGAVTVTVADMQASTSLDNNSVTSAHIQDDTIQNIDINSAAGINFSKLEALTSGQMLVGNVSNQAAAVAMSGDVTLDNTGAATIAAGAVDNSKIGAGAAISFTKLENLNSGNLLVGNPSNQAASVAMSGDATMDNTGALSLANQVVDGAEVANYSVDAVAAGVPVVLVFDTAGGATANTDKTLTYAMHITGVKFVNKANGTSGDTIQLQTGAGAAISDVVSVGGVSGSVARESNLDLTNAAIAAAGTLRIAQTDGGGSDSPAVRVIVEGYRVA